jgi:hypothetical protein
MSSGTDWVTTLVGAYAAVKGVNASVSHPAVSAVVEQPQRAGMSPMAMWVGAGLVGLLALAMIKR